MLHNEDVNLNFDVDKDFSDINLKVGEKIDYKYDDFSGW